MHEVMLRLDEGDMVRLKSGGPVMVVKFEVEHMLLCVWTDAGGRVHRRTFEREQLQLVHQQSPTWLCAAACLMERWPIVAVC